MPTLHEDRVFDPDPEIRRFARAVYESTRDLPIVSPHGHVDARLFADDAPLPEPTALFLQPDHYIFRMLHSRGVPLEAIGLPSRDGGAVETNPRRVWYLFARHYYLFRGTPTAVWFEYQLNEVFGIGTPLTADSSARIYDALREKLASPEFHPRALYERFRIEVLATTDAATDDLKYHRRICDSGWTGRVIPTFRPDALVQIAAPAWRTHLDALADVTGAPIAGISAFLHALERRREYFRDAGATAADHGVEAPRTARLDDAEAEQLFARALDGRATADDQRAFEAHMLMEFARMSANDRMVMQLHAGSLRDHDRASFARFGPNIGADIPVAAEFTRNLRELLNAYGNDPGFRIILFTLDEATYARELAPLAGYYPAVLLGPAWWFHDSIEGMQRFRLATTETAGIYNTAGFNDDTRSFCSIPARHDLSRRVDANWLAGLVARHVIDLPAARDMAHALAYQLARDAYRLQAVRQ